MKNKEFHAKFLYKVYKGKTIGKRGSDDVINKKRKLAPDLRIRWGRYILMIFSSFNGLRDQKGFFKGFLGKNGDLGREMG